MNTPTTKLTEKLAIKIVEHAVKAWADDPKEGYDKLGTDYGRLQYRRDWLMDFTQSHYPEVHEALVYANGRMSEGLERYPDASPTSRILSDDISKWAQGLRIRFGHRVSKYDVSGLKERYTKLLESGHLVPSDYVIALLLNEEVEKVTQVREEAMNGGRWRLTFNEIGGGWHVVDINEEWKKLQDEVSNMPVEQIQALIERIKQEERHKKNIDSRI